MRFKMVAQIYNLRSVKSVLETILMNSLYPTFEDNDQGDAVVTLITNV
jgi:hypothetical protein